MKKILATVSLLALAACGNMESGSSSSGSDGWWGKFGHKGIHGVAVGGEDSDSSSPAYTGTKVGKAYTINGKTYEPKHNPSYNKEGMASWYGPGFHGKKTANGEVYNQYAYTAAHTTLPLPSIVRVTNLENGRALNVRVNDRGPFHGNRILDLSKAAADKLGVIQNGVAHVRVQYLEAETEQYVASKGKSGDDIRFSTDFAAYDGLKPVRGKVTEPEVQVASADVPEEKPVVLAKAALPEAKPIAVREIAVAETPEAPAAVSAFSVLSQEEVLAEETLALAAPVAQQGFAASGGLPDNRPWVIQVASYADKVNAEKLQNRLLGMGEAQVQQAMVGGAAFYRVMLAPTSQADDRFDMLSQLRDRFGIDDAKLILK